MVQLLSENEARLKMIFVSTSCLKGTRDLASVLEVYGDHGISNVELGSSHEYIGGVKDVLKEHFDMNFIVHNYFPPVKEPFIMNLAAQDEQIRSNSITICKRAIDLCNKFDYSLYSFHPGFRMKKTLGLNFDMNSNYIVPYDAAFEAFCLSVEDISAHAKKKGVNIALENLEHQNRAYMMTRPWEFIRFLDNFPEVGVLLDVGHLKIASQKFGFSIKDFVKSVKDNIFAVHLHENDGESDLHLEPLNSNLLNYLENINCDIFVLESRNLSIDRIMKNVNFLEGRVDWG